MNINLLDYFSLDPVELDEFEKKLELCNDAPPEGGFDRLLAARAACLKLSAFQEGSAKPASFGILAEIVADAVGKNRFRLADDLQIDATTWNKMILDQGRPDILPAFSYAAFAKAYSISIESLKSALEGTFRLIQAGVSGTSAVFTRSDRKTTKNMDVSAAMHELLRKSGRTAGALDQKALAFLKEVESWMMK